MNSKPFTVYGEALESESEEEIDSTSIFQNEGQNQIQFKQCHGKIVSGEAPESDDDENEHLRNLKSTNTSISPLPFLSQQKKKSKKPNSILVKKLCERNAFLNKNLNNFISALREDAENKLNATNQRLLKCQLRMQEGIQCLKILNFNLKLLDLKPILTTDYIPVISTKFLEN